MQLAATGLLAAMAGLYALTTAWPHQPLWLAYVRAFAEAGTVGACADWFAVTALFRRPFGLPIPHTAVIPRNKDRIGVGLGDFIADNFLTAEVLEGRLRQLEVGRWGAAWLRQPGNAADLSKRIAKLIPELLDLSSADARRRFVGAIAADAIAAMPAAHVAAGVLRAVSGGAQGEAMVDAGLDFIARAIAANQDLFRAEVAGRTYHWLPHWLDKKIADKMLSALSGALEAMREPAHPSRDRFRRYFEGVIEMLETDLVLASQAENLKRQIASSPALLAGLGELADAIEVRLRPSSDEEARQLAERLAGFIVGFGTWLHEQTDAIAIFNAWARQAVQRIIAPRRHEIGHLVGSVVASWDARDVVDRLELQVGADLQYIRINGTIVGGLAGLVIFALSEFLGAPR